VAELEGNKNRVSGQITAIGENTSNILQGLKTDKFNPDALSHTVFQIYPTDESRRLDGCQCDVASQWIFDSLLNACETREANAAALLYRQLSTTSWAASFRGHLFERQVLKYLDGIQTEHVFTIRRLADSNEMTWTYDGGKTTRVIYHGPDEIKTTVTAKQAAHLVPSATNFAAVDSIIYHPDDVLTLIQVTMNKSRHPIKVKGLRDIQRWFRKVGRYVGTAGLLPTKKDPWRFVFIVPPDMVGDFDLQELDGDTKKGEWAGKMTQYVLLSEGLEVFGRAHNSTQQCLDLADSS
jgi:hypothetical protein